MGYLEGKSVNLPATNTMDEMGLQAELMSSEEFWGLFRPGSIDAISVATAFHWFATEDSPCEHATRCEWKISTKKRSRANSYILTVDERNPAPVGTYWWQTLKRKVGLWRDKPSAKWCRISSIHSMLRTYSLNGFLWPFVVGQTLVDIYCTCMIWGFPTMLKMVPYLDVVS